MGAATIVRTVVRGAVVAGLILALAGCGESSTSGGPQFVGRTYIATSVTQDGTPRAVVPGSQLRLSFQEDAVGASAGCNTMSGSGGITEGILVVTDLATTEMACDPALMEQESWWAELLTGRPAAEVGERALTLTSGSTVVAMTSAENVPDLPLAGTGWQLQSIIEGGAASSVPAGTSAALAVDGSAMTVTVSDCRSTTVAIVENGTRLTFDPQPFAQPLCTGQSAVTEAAVLGVFGGGQVDVVIDGEVLTVDGAGGASLDYRG